MSPTSISLGNAEALAFLFLGFVLFAGIAALSHAAERNFSAPMIYLCLGAAGGAAIRFLHIGRLADPVRNPHVLGIVTTVALALGLFATGMRIRRRPTLDGWHVSLRLIAVAMPAAIAAGAAWARGLMGLGLGAAIALGATLAPTDPVLAGDLGVRPPEDQEEPHPEAEFVLTSEAGLNDGAAMPFVLLGAAVVRGDSLWRWAATSLVYSVVGGIVVGAVLGRTIAIVATELRKREFLSTDFDRWIGLAAGLGVYGAAQALGMLGLLAAFAGGIAFRQHEIDAEYRRDVHDGASVITHFAELAVILVFGSTLVIGGFGKAGGWGIGLAAASVFAIRPLLALATLARTGRLTVRERLWVAWFGVRGVASLNYVAAIAAAGAFAGREREAIAWTALTAVALSIVVHGATATALTPRLLRHR